MAAYPQSVAYTRMFKMIDSADHFSKKTGLTCTVNLSKAGAAFGAAGGSVTEVANGWYKVALSTTDTNTVGDMAFYITATGADDTDFVDQVTDPVRGLGAPTALPNAAAGASGGLLISGSNSGTTTLAALTVSGAVTLSGAVSATSGVTFSNAGGDALTLTSSGSNGNAINASGNGSGSAILATAGATGNGIKAVGGATSGNGINVSTTSGDGISITPTAGNGIVATANGTSKHGIVSTGGTAGTSDGVKCVAGTGGVDLRAAITGNVTGNLSGSVGSVTGAVGSVTGAVGSVTGAVGSVTGNVGGNVVGSVASVTAAVSVTGDLSATMKTSVQTASDAAVTANTLVNAIAGYIDTEVAAIKAKTDNLPAAFPTNFADLAITASTGKVTVGTNSDKTGYALSATGSAALTESYAADGAAFTLNQAIYQIWSLLAEKSISSTTLTSNKLDGSTAAMTFTLDSATTPSSITRAT